MWQQGRVHNPALLFFMQLTMKKRLSSAPAGRKMKLWGRALI
jgi:hypothetical protein